MVPRIYLDQIDALIVFEQGKEIAGTGMDLAIVGRPINRLPNIGPEVEALGILRVSSHSQGNASGCGMADFITRKLRDSINEEATIVNSLTGMKPFLANIPPNLETDELVFKACIKGAGQIKTEDLKLVIIRNSRNLDEIYFSKAALDAVSAPDLVEQVSDFEEVDFTDEGSLQLFDDTYD